MSKWDHKLQDGQAKGEGMRTTDRVPGVREQNLSPVQRGIGKNKEEDKGTAETTKHGVPQCGTVEGSTKRGQEKGKELNDKVSKSR